MKDVFYYPKNFEEVANASQIQFFDEQLKGSVIQDYKSFEFENRDDEWNWPDWVEHLILINRIKISQ